jgi:hypothetical protein
MSFDDVARRMQQRHDADAFTESALVDADDYERQSRRNADIGFGLVLLIVGILITAVTYDSASQQGGTYVIAYGPIVVGAIRLIRGLAT